MSIDEPEDNPIGEIAAERRRQIEQERWSDEHDDQHVTGDLAAAASCYANPDNDGAEEPPRGWLWDSAWWKPRGRRRDLVRAAALIVAEIERIDRARGEAS